MQLSRVSKNDRHWHVFLSFLSPFFLFVVVVVVTNLISAVLFVDYLSL